MWFRLSRNRSRGLSFFQFEIGLPQSVQNLVASGTVREHLAHHFPAAAGVPDGVVAAKGLDSTAAEPTSPPAADVAAAGAVDAMGADSTDAVPSPKPAAEGAADGAVDGVGMGTIGAKGSPHAISSAGPGACDGAMDWAGVTTSGANASAHAPSIDDDAAGGETVVATAP